MKAAIFSLALSALFATPASAILFSTSAPLSASSPGYVPVQDGAPPTALGSTTVRYDSFAFTVSDAGSYAITLGTSGGYNPYLALYLGSFDPSAPLNNVLAAKSAPGGYGATIVTNLLANTVYVAALGGTIAYPSPNGVGAGLLSLNGPGTVTRAAPVASGVPEPATWATMVLGFGATAFAVRRRAGAAAKVRLA